MVYVTNQRDVSFKKDFLKAYKKGGTANIRPLHNM